MLPLRIRSSWRLRFFTMASSSSAWDIYALGARLVWDVMVYCYVCYCCCVAVAVAMYGGDFNGFVE